MKISISNVISTLILAESIYYSELGAMKIKLNSNIVSYRDVDDSLCKLVFNEDGDEMKFDGVVYKTLEDFLNLLTNDNEDDIEFIIKNL